MIEATAKRVLSALAELKESGALEDYQCEEIQTGKAVADVKYTPLPSDEFIKEQKQPTEGLQILR